MECRRFMFEIAFVFQERDFLLRLVFGDFLETFKTLYEMFSLYYFS